MFQLARIAAKRPSVERKIANLHNFRKRGQPPEVHPNFRKHFIPEYPEFWAEWFAFRKFNKFQIFCNFSQEMSVPFNPVSKISEFLVEWKAPCSLIYVAHRRAETQKSSPAVLHMEYSVWTSFSTWELDWGEGKRKTTPYRHKTWAGAIEVSVDSLAYGWRD